MSQISFENSIPTQNASHPYSFEGTYVNIIEYSEINLLFSGVLTTAGDNIVITAFLSNDRVNLLESIINTINYEDPTHALFKITPSANYFKIGVVLHGTISNLNLSTVLKTNLILSNLSVNGTVAITATNGNALTANDGALDVNLVNSIGVEVIGKEPQYVFYATPATNVPIVYADGSQGITVNGGWLYVNTGSPQKINWYVYGNTAEQPSTAKRIQDIQNMYAVIYQNTSAVIPQTNPYIAFYSLMDAGTNSAGWYKNRFVFANYYETNNVIGTKLLYIGVDNPLIHPEITTRVQLNFDPITSTSTLLASANELLYLSSLQTDSTTSVGRYNFVFSELGINFNEDALNAIVLPIIDNKVQVAGSLIISSTVGLTNTELRATAIPVSGSFFQSTQPISGNVSVTGVSTETTLSAINTKTPALGQALAPVSVPVVLTALQLTVLTPTDPYLQTSKSLIAGSTPVYISGVNISNNAGTEDLWGSAPSLWITPTAATTVNIISNNANDNSVGGTGARTVSITGLNGSYVEVTETLNLNGTVNVATANSYFIIHKILVLTAGTGDKNAGIISSIWTGGGTPVGPNLTVGQNASQSCIYQVPAGYTLYVTNYDTSMVNSANCITYLMAKPFGGVYNMICPIALDYYSTYAYKKFGCPMKFLAKTTIKLMTVINVNPTDVFGSIDGVLVAN